MDELELLDRFWEHIPEPDPGRVHVARGALMERIGSDLRSQRLRKPRRRVSRRWAVSLFAAATVAVAVAVPVFLPADGPGGAGSARAAAVLHRIALVAAHQPAEQMLGVGQYFYEKTESVSTLLYVSGPGLSNFSFTIPMTSENWLGSDGSGRTIETSGEVSFPTAEDRAAWEGAGSPDLVALVGENGDHHIDPGGQYFLDLSSLPTDPEQLQTIIEERRIVGGDSADWVTFQIIGEMLQGTYASPALRAALYEVAANLPGVEYVGHVTDGVGRDGLAVAYPHSGIRDEMIFDPNTAQLLGRSSVLENPDEAEVLVGPDTAPGTVIAYAGDAGTIVDSTVFLVSGVVDSTRARP